MRLLIAQVIVENHDMCVRTYRKDHVAKCHEEPRFHREMKSRGFTAGKRIDGFDEREFFFLLSNNMNMVLIDF